MNCLEMDNVLNDLKKNSNYQIIRNEEIHNKIDALEMRIDLIENRLETILKIFLRIF